MVAGGSPEIFQDAGHVAMRLLRRVTSARAPDGIRSPVVAGLSRWLRRLAPWVVAAAVVAVLVWRYSPRAIARELVRGDVLGLLPWVAAVALAALAVMAAADWLVFARALGDTPRRLRLSDVARGRAATAILTSLNYGLSSGGYGVWLARRTGSGVAPAVGAATYQVLSDLGGVCLFALPAALLGSHLLPDQVGGSAAVLAAAGLAAVAALLVVGSRAAPRRWRSSRVVTAWARVPVMAWAAGLLLRAGAIGINIIGTWGAARAFGLDISLAALAAGLPIVYLIGALPVNVLGLGAVQAAWLALFGAYAPGAQILAFQFAYQLITAAVMVARGLPFLPSVMRDLDRSDRSGDAQWTGQAR
jgi:hypothetical protein